MIDWIIKLIIAVASCAFWYNKGYSDGCCESLERQATEYMRKHAPKMYKDFSKEVKQDDAGRVQETAGETES